MEGDFTGDVIIICLINEDAGSWNPMVFLSYKLIFIKIL
jgi:hypothetical protein